MIKMNKDYEISNEQLIIKTTIPFQSLSKMEICHDVNTHIAAKISVIVKEENQQEILSRDWSDTEITVLKKGEENHKKFFCDILGIGEADYKYMRQMVRLQHIMTSNDDYTYSSVYNMSIYNKAGFRTWKAKMEEATGEELSKAAYLELYQKMYDAVGEKGDFSHMMYKGKRNERWERIIWWMERG